MFYEKTLGGKLVCLLVRHSKNSAKMPDRDVKTIRDLVYYQYAKIVGRRETF